MKFIASGHSSLIQGGSHIDPFQDVHGLVRGHVGVVLHVLGLRVVALSYGKGMRP